MKLPFIFLSLFLYANIYAQRLEHTSSLAPSTTKNLRIDYENDFFVGLDQYYSQGMGFNFNHPKLSFNPCNFIFPKIKNSSSTYGLYLSQEVYTPINIGSEIIQLNDRPFAAKLSLDSYRLAKNKEKKTMFYAGLELGVIGPFGFGKEMQSFLHHITNSVKPKGWKNQIKNTLLVNYSLGIEKSLLDFNSLFNLNGHFNGTLGTGNMHINTGITFQLGRINDLFSNEINNWSLYFFYKPNLKIIGYDASLQGSLFQDNSTYKLSDIAFLVFSQTFGISVISKKVYIEFSYSGMSKEFKTGDCHQWGALKLGYIL